MKILTQIKMTNSTNSESWRRRTPRTVTTTNSTDGDGETEPNSPPWLSLTEKMAPRVCGEMAPNTMRGRKMREEKKKKRGLRKEKKQREMKKAKRRKEKKIVV